MPWLMVVLLVVDCAAPFLAGVALFFLLKDRRIAPWKAIAAVTGGYLLYANIVSYFLILFASSFLLLQATEAVARVLGEESLLRSLDFQSAEMRWRLFVYPLFVLSIVPSVFAWGLQFLVERSNRRKEPS